MELLNIVFYAFAILIIASAAVVVCSKNIMYSAFALLFTFFGVAGIYVLLNADFIAITQIMVYIGGILVLIIFGVMLTTKITGIEIKTGMAGKTQIYVTALACLVLGVFLSLMYSNVKWITQETTVLNDTITPIGRLLLTDYLLPFEVSAVLLLIAFVGAALIARRTK